MVNLEAETEDLPSGSIKILEGPLHRGRDHGTIAKTSFRIDNLVDAKGLAFGYTEGYYHAEINPTCEFCWKLRIDKTCEPGCMVIRLICYSW